MSLTLGIETSCDETAVAVLEDNATLRSNVVSSQLAEHRPYGGVVPELAARAHLENLPEVLDLALERASVELADVDQLGVTSGPGLVGALLVGASYAKGLALGLQKPLYAVNHLQAHLFAALLDHPDLRPPFVGLVVSGGHTVLVRVEEWGRYETLGETRDDAAGEAFDKVAKLLGLGYPGGRRIEELARDGDPQAIPLPRPMLTDASLDFSFSGLKTAVARLVGSVPEMPNGWIGDMCASFQQAVIDSLSAKTFRSLREEPAAALVVAGGVSRNQALRTRFAREAAALGIPLLLPQPDLCTDNAAMVARAAFHLASRKVAWSLDFDVRPDLRLEAPADGGGGEVGEPSGGPVETMSARGNPTWPV